MSQHPEAGVKCGLQTCGPAKG